MSSSLTPGRSAPHSLPDRGERKKTPLKKRKSRAGEKRKKRGGPAVDDRSGERERAAGAGDS